MPKLEIRGFDGVIPRESDSMLADNQATQADNVKLYSGELRYWRGPTFTFTPLISNVRTIYRLYNASASTWLTWANIVDVVAGPLADTSDYRIYYTGDTTPRKTNYTLAATGVGAAPNTYYEMGVPAPTAAPTLGTSAGASVGTEDRAYVYTFISTFGAISEESAPSPAATVTVAPAKQVDLSALQTAPAGNYNITAKRIYRVVSGATTASYVFVKEVPIATTATSDNLLVAALGAAITTIGWVPPPSTLAGLVSLPCGSLAGFSKNTVYFSEPFYPHAWPLAYALSVPYTIIGLGVYGTSIVVMTDRYPYVISGPYPGSYTMERVPILEPCLSKQTIVSDETGVVYASPNGLVGIGPTMRGVLTNSLFRRDEWQAISPSTIKAVSYDGKYVGFYPTLDGRSSIVLSRDDVPALSYITTSADAAYVDGNNAGLYYIDASNNIQLLDSDTLNPTTYQWKSKRFVMPQAITWSALRLDANYDQIAADAAYNATVAAIQAANALTFAAGLFGGLNDTQVDTYAVNGDALLAVPSLAGARFAQVLIYGDGVLGATMTLTSLNPVRLPPFKAQTYQIKIVGTIDVRSVALATTVLELRTQ